MVSISSMVGKGKYCANPECKKWHYRQKAIYCTVECAIQYSNDTRRQRDDSFDKGIRRQIWNRTVGVDLVRKGRAIDPSYGQYKDKDRAYQNSVECQHRRRARMLAVVGNFSEAQFLELWTNSGGICRYCKKYVQYGTAECTRDHSIPVSFKGSSNDISNIVVCCRRCNSSKGATTGSKYIARVYKGKYMERRQKAA
jgi:5-methylcytosine-specific restriction endonuclease McrA